MSRLLTKRQFPLAAIGILLLAVCSVKDAFALGLQFPLIDHPAYAYLNRLETTGDMPLLSRSRPFLQFVHHSPNVDSDFIETREYRRYRDESEADFYVIGQRDVPPRESNWLSLRRRAGLTGSWFQWLYGSGYNFAVWKYDTTFSASVQPVYGLDVINTDDLRGTISRFTGGIRVEGGYARRIHYMMDFRDHTEAGNGPYDSRTNLYEDRWAAVGTDGGSSTSYDISESFIQYYGRDLSIAAGRGRFYWGPGEFGSLFLNSQMPPFDYVRFDAVLEANKSDHAVYYTFLHGWLQSNIVAESLYVNPDGRPRTLNAQKYFSAQRLELRPRGNILLGFSQGVVYGDRGVQLSYLTPLNFLYSAQHSNDDKDNLVLAFDGTWRVFRGFKIYGQAFFDDINVSALTTTAAGNKSAFTVGAQGIIPRGIWRKFDATVEYTRIRPFVYSHFFATNTYTHWTSPIGYTLEPNSEFMTAQLRGTFYPVQITLRASHENHGVNTDARNVGGNIYDPNYEGSGGIYPLLEGRLERTTRVSLRATWEALPRLNFYGQGAYVKRTGIMDRFETSAGFGWNLW